MKSEDLEKELKQHGVDVGKLAVFFTGTESLIGEIVEHPDSRESRKRYSVKNPKRILRLQQAVDGGIVLSFMVGDFDLMAEGTIEVDSPVIHYEVHSQPEVTKAGVLGTYLEYFQRKVANKAVEAGLVLPKTNLSPFRKG